MSGVQELQATGMKTDFSESHFVIEPFSPSRLDESLIYSVAPENFLALLNPPLPFPR
jgi:hypothetical protein